MLRYNISLWKHMFKTEYICSQIPSKVRQIKTFNVSLLAKSILPGFSFLLCSCPPVPWRPSKNFNLSLLPYYTLHFFCHFHYSQFHWTVYPLHHCCYIFQIYQGRFNCLCFLWCLVYWDDLLFVIHGECPMTSLHF